MNKRQKITIILMGALLCSVSTANELTKNLTLDTLTLDRAIQLAIDNDPWLKGVEYRQQALESRAIAAGQLPDPKLSLNILNLPTDTFEFDQEPMTQLKVGVSQQFPRGKTRALKQQQLEQRSEQTVYQREDRKAMVTLTVTQLWLEWLRQQKTIALIEKDRSLFEDLAEIVNANYASAFGKTQQHDIIQAQVELTRLEDRLYRLSEAADIHLAKLNEWLPTPIHTINHSTLPRLTIRSSFPMKDTGLNETFINDTVINKIAAQHFLQHPKILQLDQTIATNTTAMQLAKQQYKPQWGVNTSYAFRDDDAAGNDRADFFSVGVTLDLPLFTANRQDKQVDATIAETEASKTEKWQLLRSFVAKTNQAKAKLQRLEQRQQLYQTRLLKEIHEQVEASLTAYTNDNTDFNQVVRARITELNSRIDALSIDIDRLQAIAQLNYLFTQAEKTPANTTATEGAKP
ncbi:MAG: TolC family protein [Cellvibrionaceae bacterium]